MPKKALLNIDTTGFGNKSSQSGSRLYKKDGTPNVIKKGTHFLDRLSLYHSMLSMPKWKFLLYMLVVYVLINIIFAAIYFTIGVENLGGVKLGSDIENFTEAFFFSAQTFTTVGYGRISPASLLTSAIAAFEAFIGLLAFAIATGLFYGRFSRPRAFLKYSQNLLISPYKEGTALMFRIAPFKNNYLIDVEVKLTAVMRINTNGVERNMFYSLPVEFEKINALILNWTIVHPINEDSPLYGMTSTDLVEKKLELIVFIKAFDEAFSNTVVSRTSYTADEIIAGAKFTTMYYPDPDGSATILSIDKLSDFEKVPLPPIIPAEA